MPGERTKRKAPAGPEPSAQAQKGSRSRGDKGATATGVSAQSADKQWRQQYQKVQEAKRRRAENQEAVSPAAWQEVNATLIDQDSQSGTAIENTVVSRRSINHPVFLNRRWQRVRQVNADGTDGRPYWFDVHTGETSWVPPPPPQLNADGSVDLAQRPTSAAASGKRGHRKHLSAATVLRKWPKDGFFIGPNQELRCLCSRREYGPWDREMVTRHVVGKGHVDMKNKVVKVSLPHFTCHISMPDLAKNIIAVSSILSVKKTKARKHARSV